jgi:hypothetical protein
VRPSYEGPYQLACILQTTESQVAFFREQMESNQGAAVVFNQEDFALPTGNICQCLETFSFSPLEECNGHLVSGAEGLLNILQFTGQPSPPPIMNYLI